MKLEELKNPEVESYLKTKRTVFIPVSSIASRELGKQIFEKTAAYINEYIRQLPGE